MKNNCRKLRQPISFVVWIFLFFPLQGADTVSPGLEKLHRRILDYTSKYSGKMGVAIKHLEGGKEMVLQADEFFPMASTYKLPILVEVMYQVSEGKLSLDEMIEIKREHLHVGSGTLSDLFIEPGVSLSVRNVIDLMMWISDNSATDLLLVRVGAGNVNRRLKTLGVDGIVVNRTTQELILDKLGLEYSKYSTALWKDIEEPLKQLSREEKDRANDNFNKEKKDVSTPRAMNLLLAKLHRGEIVSTDVSNRILEIMKKCQTGRARIRGLLPQETVVAHKTGTIGQTTNDVGIIYLPHGGGHLAISLFAKEMNEETSEVEKLLAEISRLAFDYFTLN